MQLKEWDTEYINSLPDEAFAVIEPAYKKGETEDKRCRHLPHHTGGVKNGSDSEDNIDIDHLRNAWQRRNQIKPVTDSISVEELRARAGRHLKKHIKDLGLNWGEEKIELIPGQFSLSSSGEGYIKLIASALTPVFPSTISGETSLAIDSDFIKVRFRALSQIYIEDYCLDFTKPNVLQKATPLLKHQTVYPDHDVRIANWLGVVEETYWDDKSQPPGIDADLKIDAKTNPKIARGLLIQPPAIHSASVTTFFLWSKSHPDLTDDEFFAHLGEERDGSVVRIIVDEILSFGEISLVWQGADPFAKRKMAKLKKGEKVDGINQLKQEIIELKKKNEELTTQLNTSQILVKVGKEHIENVKKETESLYRLIHPSPDEEFIKIMIKDAPFEQVSVLKKEYEEKLQDKLFFTCPHCGNLIKSIRSSQENQSEKIEDLQKHKI